VKKRRAKKAKKRTARKSPNAAVVKELRTIVGQMSALLATMREINWMMPRQEPKPGGPTGCGPSHRPIILPNNFFVPPGLQYPKPGYAL
jgi:hypothetical protein